MSTLSSLRLDHLGALPLRTIHTWVGAWALLYDAAQDVVRQPAHYMDRIERRGLALERVLTREWQSLARSGFKRLPGAALGPLHWARREVAAGGQYAEDEIERQVERVLERLGIPSRERLERLSDEIESLSAKIDLELAHLDELLAAERALP